MRKTIYLVLILLLVSGLVRAQEKNFSIHGKLNLPDGTTIGVSAETDTAFFVDFGNAVLKDGSFEVKGYVDRPLKGMFTTNNLEIVEKNHWPVDSVRWNYIDFFLSKGDITVNSDLTITGTPVLTDFNELQTKQAKVGEGDLTGVWTEFITAHPNSAVSVFLANKMLKRGYNLTKEQVDFLGNTITSVPDDEIGFNAFKTSLAAARKTVKGAPLADLELKTTDGKIVRLTDIVKGILKSKPGNYVFVDFWASWCGICLASMDDVKKIQTTFPGKATVIGVSIDTKDAAWKKSMAKHQEPWKQYCTTANGYKDLFSKYQIGNGVPYYLLIAPDGTVITSPSSPADALEILKGIIK